MITTDMGQFAMSNVIMDTHLKMLRKSLNVFLETGQSRPVYYFPAVAPCLFHGGMVVAAPHFCQPPLAMTWSCARMRPSKRVRRTLSRCAPPDGTCAPPNSSTTGTAAGTTTEEAGAGNPIGAIYCYGGPGYAAHYTIQDSNPVLNTDQQLNCEWESSRPGCEFYAGWDCDEKSSSALCCAPSTTCGDGLVQEEEEDCDDGNEDQMDECLDTCTWKFPRKHGLSGC